MPMPCLNNCPSLPCTPIRMSFAPNLQVLRTPTCMSCTPSLAFPANPTRRKRIASTPPSHQERSREGKKTNLGRVGKRVERAFRGGSRICFRTRRIRPSLPPCSVPNPELVRCPVLCPDAVSSTLSCVPTLCPQPLAVSHPPKRMIARRKKHKSGRVGKRVERAFRGGSRICFQTRRISPPLTPCYAPDPVLCPRPCAVSPALCFVPTPVLSSTLR